MPSADPSTVLMTADAIGGVWTYALELAAALPETQFILAVMGGPVPQRPDLPNVQCLEGPFRLEWMENPWEDVRAAGDWLLELERRFEPDLIHLNGYAHAVLPWRSPVMVVGHSCVLSWWSAVHGEPAPPSWGRYREAVRNGLAAADVVVAPSRAMLAALRQHYCLRLESAQIIPNARTSGPPAAEKESFIFSAGRLWDQAKNISTLVHASETLAWPLYLAGPQEGGAVLRGRAPARPPLFLGPLPPTEVRRWQSRASIYALPALYEPFGLSILEAAQSGCALVLGDIPSLRENWDGAAAFADPRDDRALAATLRVLIEDPAHRACLQQRARARASEFAPSRLGASYRELYSRNLCGS